MRKRAKIKISNSLSKIFIFIVKSPFILLGWLIKNLFTILKDFLVWVIGFLKNLIVRIKEKKKSTSKDNERVKSKIKKEIPIDPQHIVRAGSLRHNPTHTSLQEMRNFEGDFDSFENKLYTQKSSIGLILGARGTGKSALGMRILENIHSQTQREVYALGFKAESLPSWITTVSSLEAVPNGCFLLIDEGGLTFSSRKSMSDKNTLLSELLFIARHKDVSALFITQNSSTIEVNVLRQADYLFLKPSSLLQKEFERSKIQDMYQDVDEHFQKHKDVPGLTYVYANAYRGFMTNTLPSFWSDDVSKAFAKRK